MGEGCEIYARPPSTGRNSTRPLLRAAELAKEETMNSSKSSSSLLLATLLLPSACAIPSIDIIPRYGTMDVSGDYAAKGSSADLNTAGLQEDDGYIGGRVDLDMGWPTISFSTQTTTHDGTGVLTDTLEVDGVVIPAAAIVNTDLDLSVHNLCVTYSIVPIPFFDVLDVGLGFGASLIQIDASIQEQAGNFDTINADEDVPLPTLAARIDLDLGNFEASALFMGMSLDLGDVAADYYDFDVLAQYKVFGLENRFRAAIGLGYRSTAMDFEYEDSGDQIEVNVDLDGPYLALNFSF